MLWVVIPAWNEAENLAVLLPQILREVNGIDDEGRVLVVDDGSRDGTDRVVAEFAEAHPAVVLERSRRNRGKAAALHRGFALALEGGADVVVMMDADGQDDPVELPRLVAEVRKGNADLVTGARGVRKDRFVKRTTSRLYNGVTRVVSGTPGRDFNSGFKAMSADVVAEVQPMMYGEMHRYLTVLAHRAGYVVDEVQVDHHERMFGESKYGLARFWRGFADLLTVRFLLSYENRPSHLFSAIGMLCLAVGLLVLTYLTGLKLTGEAIGGRPLLIGGVLATLSGLQLVLFGFLAELVVHARHRPAARAGTREW